jgi:hypothetical protein
MVDRTELSGRTRKPWQKKINPLWWVQNDSEQTVDQANWYHPEWPQWRRRFTWSVIRNPLQNFRAYVIGVQDRNYKVIGRKPVTCVQRDDLQPPETGWQWCVLYGGELIVPLPFVSYCHGPIKVYAGWQWNGFAGIKVI